MKPTYMLAFVAIAAVLAISLMLVNYKSVTGAAANQISSVTEDKINSCTDQFISDGFSEGNSQRYCECLILYGSAYKCQPYLDME